MDAPYFSFADKPKTSSKNQLGMNVSKSLRYRIMPTMFQ